MAPPETMPFLMQDLGHQRTGLVGKAICGFGRRTDSSRLQQPCCICNQHFGLASADAGNADLDGEGLAEPDLTSAALAPWLPLLKAPLMLPASSVTGSTDASALQQSVGIASGLDMDTSSDAAVSSNSTIVGGADASSTSGAIRWLT